MSSYIRYMFKYLFEPDALPAELASEHRQASAPDSSAASSALGSLISKTVGELNERLNQTAATASNKSLGASFVDWLWQAAGTTALAPDNDSGAAQISTPSSQMNTNARLPSPMWPSKCLELARMLTAALATTTPPPPTTASSTTSAHRNRITGPGPAAGRLGSFAEFEHLIRQRQLLTAATSLANSSAGGAASDAGAQHSLGSHWSANNWNATSDWANVHSTQQQQAASSLELLECYNQLQLSEYYQSYDIFVGLRIATSLFILFSVFLLFVIYKTGCAGDGERASRSQLRLTSSSASARPTSARAARRLSLIKRRPPERCKCAAEQRVSTKPQARPLVPSQAQGPLEAKAPVQPADLETGQARQA